MNSSGKNLKKCQKRLIRLTSRGARRRTRERLSQRIARLKRAFEAKTDLLHPAGYTGQ